MTGDADRPPSEHACRTRLGDLVARFARLPVIDPRSPEKIVGYDDNGLPV